MQHPLKAIYTCTPVAFHANRGFHIRDTGLIARHLRKLGIESKCIMPLPSYEDDQDRENLIRTDYRNLSDTNWWRSLHIDGVVLYSWAAPRYLPIARAIHRAGLKLLLHLDSNGDFWRLSLQQAKGLEHFRLRCKMPLTDILRARHMRYADYITTAPPVADRLRHLRFYGRDIADKCQIMPCPVASECAYNGQAKKPTILFVGRWDDAFFKRPAYMCEALEQLFTSHAHVIPHDAQAEIYGTITNDVRTWHEELPPTVRERIKLNGYVDNTQLPPIYSRAQIIACTSRSEGSHNVSAEALCCGASAVVSNRPSHLRIIHWYTTRNSGRISAQDTPASFAEALRDELLAWQNGERDPHAIAAAWQPIFHADLAMARIFGIPCTQQTMMQG